MFCLKYDVRVIFFNGPDAARKCLNFNQSASFWVKFCTTAGRRHFCSASSDRTEKSVNLSRGAFGWRLRRKNWEGVRRSGSAVDIIPDVKTQMSQRWFWSLLSQQRRRRNDTAIMVETSFRHIWRSKGAVDPKHSFRQSAHQLYAAGNLDELTFIHTLNYHNYI